jgi:hypothetical protein
MSPDATSEEEGLKVERPQYVYGILRASEDLDLDLGLIGLGAPPAEVRTVREDDLAAVVSESPGPGLDPTRAHLLVHQRVTEAVLREHTLVPVAFGTVLPSEARVRELLRVAHGELARALDALEGRVELGLKVLYHRDHLARRLELEEPLLRRGDSEPEAVHEERLDVALRARVAGDMAALLEGLRSWALATREDPPLGELMLLNASFLVGRDAAADFEARVKSLAARTDTYAFRFTGPWPAYSFVDLRLGVVPAEASAESA